jgi:Ca2+-binding EF-hand superfamily protein
MRLPILAALLVIASPLWAQDSHDIVPIPLGAQGSPATGQSTGQPPATIVAEPVAMMIAACDSDGDGKTSRAELSQCLTRSFDAIDTAHKGSIGYIDYADWALKWLGDRNALPSPFTIDADGDNRITPAELQRQFDTLFTRFDTDKDGVLTRAELLTIRASATDDRPTGRRGKRGAPSDRP